MARLTVVDVGHGSCCVIQSGADVCIVDAPRGGGVKRFLETSGISELRYLVASHAHHDHTGGLLNLVSDPAITVDRYLVNPEHRRKPDGKPTQFEKAMTKALRIGKKKDTRVVTAVTSDSVDAFDLGSLRVEVLWPSGVAAFAGVGADGPSGNYTSNSLSVVLRVEHRDGFAVLIPGDLDAIGLDELLGDTPRLTSDVIIAPHHGGLMGSAARTLTAWRSLGEAVKPSEVLVSLGREQVANPRAEIVSGIIESGLENVRIRCTQLSGQCGTPSGAGFGSLSGLWSQGSGSGQCCAGSIVVDFAAGEVLHRDAHDDRVLSLKNPVCGALVPRPPADMESDGPRRSASAE